MKKSSIAATVGLLNACRRLAPLAVGALALCAAASGEAKQLELTFSGTFDTSQRQVFGENGSAVPYTCQITYDTSIGTLLTNFPAGSEVGSSTLLNDFVGYSSDGIISLNIAFGTEHWSKNHISSRQLGPGAVADLWFDADLDMGTVTKSWIYFVNTANNSLQLGSAEATLAGVSLMSSSRVLDMTTRNSGWSSDMVITMQVVPEPSVAYLVLPALAVLGFRLRQRRSAQAYQALVILEFSAK